MNKQITKNNIKELQRQTLINILNVKGIIYTHYKTNRKETMYIIDYPNQKIKKFSNQELESFLNKIIKKRFIFVKDKVKAKKYLKQIIKN